MQHVVSRPSNRRVCHSANKATLIYIIEHVWLTNIADRTAVLFMSQSSPDVDGEEL